MFRRGEKMIFDIEKAKEKGMDEETIRLLEEMNENTAKGNNCKFHEFENISVGNFVCTNCGFQVGGEYVMGYTDAIQHLKGRRI